MLPGKSKTRDPVVLEGLRHGYLGFGTALNPINKYRQDCGLNQRCRDV